MNRLPLILMFGCGLLIASKIFAAAAGREEFQNAYADELKNTPSIFGSSPVYHIIPIANTITFAAEYQNYDLEVVGPGVEIASNKDDSEERLHMTGWATSPYIAFSAKQFGFGFTGEIGQRNIHYFRSSTADTGYEEYLARVKYSGVGFSVFWTTPSSWLPNYIKPTLISGIKSLNVSHETSGQILEPFSRVVMNNMKYSVQNYEVGCNVSLNFVKRFTVIPWADYVTNSYTLPEGTPAVDFVANTQQLRNDAKLIWGSQPRARYGIDFAVSAWGLNLRLGGLLGILGTLNKGSDRVEDKSRAISLSIDTKGS